MNARDKDAHLDLCRRLATALAEGDAARAEVAAVRVLPAERMALTMALAQFRRGEQPTRNITAVCLQALARITEAAPHD